MSLSAFDQLYDRIPARELPFLERSKTRVRETLPYRGLKILHNTPLTLEALHKVHALLLGGADLTVTSPAFMTPDPEAVALLCQAGVPLALDGPLPDTVDVALDCGGALVRRVRPRFGAVELTASGTAHYANQPELPYPVISVDRAKVKLIETLYGIGDGFVRAFHELTGDSLRDQPVLVMGFGKVGQGIVRALQPHTRRITVVEADATRLSLARDQNLGVLSAALPTCVESAAEEAFLVVTATGRKHLISDGYQARAFRRARYRANMGDEDEFGPAFLDSEVIAAKQPVNFAIPSPTGMRYLDPVFHAHNLGLDMLRLGSLPNGVQAFPACLAEEIVDSWHLRFMARTDARCIDVLREAA